MPMGLDAAIKKRTSGEFKSEQRGGTVSFSNANQASSIQKETRQMGSFKEEVSESSGFNQVSSLQSATKQSSSMQSSSMQSSSTQQSSSFQTSSSASKQMTTSNQMSSSAMSMSSQKSMSSMTSSKSLASSESNALSFQSSGMVQQDVQQVSGVETKSLVHNQEIEQDKLKTQIVSAITDLEGDREFVDFGRENKPIDLTSPPQAYSPPPKSAFTPTKQDPFSPSKQDMFSPPPLEPMEPPKPQPVLSSFTSAPAEVAPQQVPKRNGIQNGFSEFVSSSQDDQSSLYSLRRPRQFKGRSDRPISMPVDLGNTPFDLPDFNTGPLAQPEIQPEIIDEEDLEMNLEVQQIQESSQTQSFQMNGNHEESGSIQGSSSSSSLLQKIMTPAPVEYDSGSLKRRDPRKMFTDSSFYNSKHHPTVADQVEMAHRLSSAMFNKENTASKGQQMYLTRVQNSGGMHDDDYQKHDAVPNLKLVMNPEGKMHEWDDLPEDQKPNYNQIAVHAAPNLNIPDVADPVAESLNAGIGKGGELFAKRRKRAENWVVDENSIGQAKPSAFADKFMQEQTQQQAAFQQEQFLEQQQREQISQQQISQQQNELYQQQQESKQTFVQQQQFKQEQSLEIRRQQEEQQRMAQQQIDYPQNFQHTDLKARSFTPSLDLGVHNVQGINVWANTAPRGWSTSYQRTKATPPKTIPPTVSVCPATPSLDTVDLQQRMQETRIHEEEEQLMFQQEQQMMQMQQEQQMKLQMEQQEQMRIQQQHEEQIRNQQQQEEQLMVQRQQEEQMRMQQQREEQMRIQQQQEEQMRMQQQREEQKRMQQQQEEQMRIQQQQEEQMRIQQQQEEQIRIQRQQEEQMRIQQQQEEQRRIQQQQEEQMRIQRQQEEQMRMQQQQEEQRRIQMQQEEQIRIQRQQEDQARQAAEMQRQQEVAERQRQEQVQRQEIDRQQQEMLIQQQSMSQKVTSSQISSSSSTTQSGVSEEDLEALKRREYEEWFKSQEKEALEYSACVQYQEKASESQNVVKTMVTETTEQQRFSQQQHIEQQSSHQTGHNSSISGLKQGFAVESRPEPVLTESQLAQPPMSSSSLFESSQSQSFAQQSSSIQQSSSSYSQSQTSKEVFESQEFNGGVMKGYKKKEDFASNQLETGEQITRDSGVFGGIGGDNNSLVESEFDYKKHTVKDLAKHFALVKPKTDISHTILPEQRMYNGDHGPALNYLTSSKSEMGSSSSTQSFMKKEISQEDFEASKQAYEIKKKQQQQMESQQTQSTSSQSTVVKRSETKTEQTQAVNNERRQSLRDSLMLDPATAHAESGIIDPSAILRGSDGSGGRSKSEGLFGQSSAPGETDKILNKWDNHNAIARGWGGVKENYHPVTFRGIYNVESQKNFTSQNL